MERLINNKNIGYTMTGESRILEERIPELLDRAISIMPKKGRAIKLYTGLDGNPASPYFLVFGEGIFREWGERRGPKLGPITRRQPLSRDEFLQWVATQPDPVKEKVYQNLQEYITTETPKERGEEEFPQSEYLMGY